MRATAIARRRNASVTETPPDNLQPYPNISAKTDRAATAALKAVPVLDTVVRELIEWRYERALRQVYLSNAMRRAASSSCLRSRPALGPAESTSAGTQWGRRRAKASAWPTRCSPRVAGVRGLCHREANSGRRHVRVRVRTQNGVADDLAVGCAAATRSLDRPTACGVERR